MKKETRDQAGKLYAAEGMAFQKMSQDMTMEECQKFVIKVMARNYVKRNYKWNLGRIQVLDGRGRRTACATYRDGRYVICLPKWARNEFVILHEIAHHLTTAEGKYAHDSYFATCLLNLVRNVLGREDALTLQAAYNFKGVKVRGKNGAIKARCPKERTQWQADKKVMALA
jgi:putative metallohydrolase (TIGR04338 family)